jgi:UDP-N-acetylglucosamine acyltransferase
MVVKNIDVHPTAIVEKGAKIGNNVKIGAYSIIGADVKVGDDTSINSHVVIVGITHIGKGNKIYSFTTIGEINQDLKYHGENSKVVIGDNNSIREHCTIHRGTEGGGMVTKIGNNNLLMVNTHVAHDCKIGNNNIIANNATFAGHIIIGDNVHIGGICAIHQFVKIGNGSMLGGFSALGEDLIPWGMAFASGGRRSSMQGLNLIGLKRAGYDKTDIQNALKYYTDVFENCDENTSILSRAKEHKAKYKGNPIVKEIADFLKNDTDRSFCSYRK